MYYSYYGYCRDTFFVSKPKMYRILAQGAQYNKFVKNGLKNQALMSWVTASTELNHNRTQIRGSNTSGLSVRGGHTYINSSQLGAKTIQVATTFSLYISYPFLRVDLSHYIAPLWIIFILYLLIIQAFT